MKVTQVRLSEDVDARLNSLAKHHDMAKGALIRICVDKFLDEIERTGKISITQVFTVPPSQQQKAS